MNQENKRMNEEFTGFMRAVAGLSDDQLRALQNSARRQAAGQESKFVDLSLIEDAAALELCKRSPEAFTVEAVAEEIAASYVYWCATVRARHFAIDDAFLIKRTEELLSA